MRILEWIVRFEGEGQEEREKTQKFFKDEARVELAAINPLKPFVGTRLWDRTREQGKLRDDFCWLSEDVGNRLLPFNSAWMATDLSRITGDLMPDFTLWYILQGSQGEDGSSSVGTI